MSKLLRNVYPQNELFRRWLGKVFYIIKQTTRQFLAPVPKILTDLKVSDGRFPVRHLAHVKHVSKVTLLTSNSIVSYLIKVRELKLRVDWRDTKSELVSGSHSKDLLWRNFLQAVGLLLLGKGSHLSSSQMKAFFGHKCLSFPLSNYWEEKWEGNVKTVKQWCMVNSHFGAQPAFVLAWTICQMDGAWVKP